jgi:hypothetical protein
MELEIISLMIDHTPTICDYVLGPSLFHVGNPLITDSRK